MHNDRSPLSPPTFDAIPIAQDIVDMLRAQQLDARLGAGSHCNNAVIKINDYPQWSFALVSDDGMGRWAALEREPLDGDPDRYVPTPSELNDLSGLAGAPAVARIIREHLRRRTRIEHLEYCKTRALQYVEAGDTVNAASSMIADLREHPATCDHPAIGMMLMLLTGGYLSTREEAREFINNFH